MVNVTERAIKAIIHIGKARAPHEACGLLLAVADDAGDKQYEPLVLEIPNGSKEPETSYDFTTTEARALIDEFVSEGVSFDDVVVWHTHPSHTAGPSSADLRTRDPRIKYLVLHLPTGTAYRY